MPSGAVPYEAPALRELPLSAVLRRAASALETAAATGIGLFKDRDLSLARELRVRAVLLDDLAEDHNGGHAACDACDMLRELGEVRS